MSPRFGGIPIWVAAVAVFISSRNTSDTPAFSATRHAHSGGAYTTALPLRIGRPLKSVGSCNDAIKGSIDQPASTA